MDLLGRENSVRCSPYKDNIYRFLLFVLAQKSLSLEHGGAGKQELGEEGSRSTSDFCAQERVRGITQNEITNQKCQDTKKYPLLSQKC